MSNISIVKIRTNFCFSEIQYSQTFDSILRENLKSYTFMLHWLNKITLVNCGSTHLMRVRKYI